MKRPHDAQEFIVTIMRFNVRDNILSWRFELVRLMQVIEDRGDHAYMMLEEEEMLD